MVRKPCKYAALSDGGSVLGSTTPCAAKSMYLLYLNIFMNKYDIKYIYLRPPRVSDALPPYALMNSLLIEDFTSGSLADLFMSS